MKKTIFSILRNEVFNEKPFSDLLAISNDVSLVFAISEEKKDIMNKIHKSFPSSKFIIFKGKPSDDQLIKSYIEEADSEKLIIVRDGASVLSGKTFFSVFEKLTHGKNIVTIRKGVEKKKSIFSFKNLMAKLVRLIFGFSLFEGDMRILGLDEMAVDILKNAPSRISVLSKVDTFVGLEKDVVETESVSFKKRPFSKPCFLKSFFSSLAFVCVLTTYVILTCLVPSVNVIYFHVFVLLAIGILFSISLFEILKSFLYLSIGELKMKSGDFEILEKSINIDKKQKSNNRTSEKSSKIANNKKTPVKKTVGNKSKKGENK